MMNERELAIALSCFLTSFVLTQILFLCGGTHLTTKPVDNSYSPILYKTTTTTQENNQ
jgi:hypothetical protein